MLQLDQDMARLELRERSKDLTEFEKMIELLDTSWLLRSEIVPCLVGPPGIGKTKAVMQHAKEHGCGKVVKIVASRCIPSETVGMTMPVHETKSMAIYNSMQLSSLEDGDILFLDELLEADQFVLSTLLTVIESREMADGTPLPDIQIVAATNDTVPPEQLRPNIRQRFMFQRFGIDVPGTHDYILRQTGIDVPDDVLRRLSDTGTDYNFLTPRSLTKLCLWINEAAKENKLDSTALAIDRIWSSMIGTKLKEAKIHADDSPERQIHMAVRDLVGNIIYDENNFKDCSIAEMYDILRVNYPMILEQLKGIELRETGDDVDVSF